MKLLLGRIKNFLSKLLAFNRYLALSFVLSFFLCLSFLLMILSRYYCISILKTEIVRMQNSLNEIGWDIAYDDLQFKTWWPMDLLKVKNFQLYSLDAGHKFSWKITDLAVRPQIFNCGKMAVLLSPQQELQVAEETLHLNLPQVDLNFEFSAQAGLVEMLMKVSDADIVGWAKIGEIHFGAQRMAPHSLNSRSPFFENHLLVKNVVFDAKREVPLTGTIEKIYLNANIIGTITDTGSYRESLYDWLASGGRIDLRSLIINWKPLLLVGRGDLYFNEKLQPRLHLYSSSKALIPVLDLFERQGYLDRKGVFVAKILLNNKAFKIDPQDEYNAVVTPMDYKDGKFSIENITLRNFQP